MGDCVFCGISGGSIPSERLYENKSFFSIYDNRPEVEGHTLVISKKHFETFLDLPASFGKDFIESVQKTTQILIKKYGLEGFNIINNNKKVGGQVVPHFHVHIIPRREGDSFRAWNLKKRIKGFNKKMVLYGE